jgi:hypothetical protein
MSQTYGDDIYSHIPFDNRLEVIQLHHENNERFNLNGIGEYSGGTCICGDGQEYEVGGLSKPYGPYLGDPCDMLYCQYGRKVTCQKENNNPKWKGKGVTCGRHKGSVPSGQCRCPNGKWYWIGVKIGMACNSHNDVKYACDGGNMPGACKHGPYRPGVGKKVTCGEEYGWGGKCTCPNGTVFYSGVKKGQNCAQGASFGCQNGTVSDCKEETGVWTGTKIVCGYQHGTWGGDCKCPDGAIYKVGDNGDDCATLQCDGGEMLNCSKSVDDQWKHKKVTCTAISPKICTECWDKIDIKDPKWPAKKTYTAEKLEGVNRDTPFVKDGYHCRLQCREFYHSTWEFEEDKNLQKCSYMNCMDWDATPALPILPDSKVCTKCWTEDFVSDYVGWIGKGVYTESAIQGRDKITPFVLEDKIC